MRFVKALAVAPRDPTELANRLVEAAYLSGQAAYFVGFRPTWRRTIARPLSALGSRR